MIPFRIGTMCVGAVNVKKQGQYNMIAHSLHHLLQHSRSTSDNVICPKPKPIGTFVSPHSALGSTTDSEGFDR